MDPPLARTSAGVRFEDRWEQALKGSEKRCGWLSANRGANKRMPVLPEQGVVAPLTPSIPEDEREEARCLL